MKKRFLIFLLLLSTAHPVFAASQWTVGDPQGTEDAGTIDDIIRINNTALDRLLNGTRRGLGVNYATASTLTVLPGEIAIPNASVSVSKYRETTTNTTVTWADIDTGVEATSTQYYLYTTGDTDITGMVFKISASASAPSGSTYYRQIAKFYNNSSGDIESVISYRPDYGTDYPDVIKGRISFKGSGTVTIYDSYNVSSLTDNATGNYTITWDTDFADGNYEVVCNTNDTTGDAPRICGAYSHAAGSVIIQTENIAGTTSDSDIVNVIAVGDRT